MLLFIGLRILLVSAPEGSTATIAVIFHFPADSRRRFNDVLRTAVRAFHWFKDFLLEAFAHLGSHASRHSL